MKWLKDTRDIRHYELVKYQYIDHLLLGFSFAFFSHSEHFLPVGLMFSSPVPVNGVSLLLLLLLYLHYPCRCYIVFIISSPRTIFSPAMIHFICFYKEIIIIIIFYYNKNSNKQPNLCLIIIIHVTIDKFSMEDFKINLNKFFCIF